MAVVGRRPPGPTSRQAVLRRAHGIAPEEENSRLRARHQSSSRGPSRRGMPRPGCGWPLRPVALEQLHAQHPRVLVDALDALAVGAARVLGDDRRPAGNGQPVGEGAVGEDQLAAVAERPYGRLDDDACARVGEVLGQTLRGYATTGVPTAIASSTVEGARPAARRPASRRRRRRRGRRASRRERPGRSSGCSAVPARPARPSGAPGRRRRREPRPTAGSSRARSSATPFSRERVTSRPDAASDARHRLLLGEVRQHRRRRSGSQPRDTKRETATQRVTSRR